VVQRQPRRCRPALLEPVERFSQDRVRAERYSVEDGPGASDLVGSRIARIPGDAERGQPARFPVEAVESRQGLGEAEGDSLALPRVGGWRPGRDEAAGHPFQCVEWGSQNLTCRFYPQRPRHGHFGSREGAQDVEFPHDVVRLEDAAIRDLPHDHAQATAPAPGFALHLRAPGPVRKPAREEIQCLDLYFGVLSFRKEPGEGSARLAARSPGASHTSHREWGG